MKSNEDEEAAKKLKRIKQPTKKQPSHFRNDNGWTQ